MSTTEVTNIVVGVIVVGALVAIQMRARSVRENSAARLVLILGVIGVIELYDATKGHTIGATTVAWIAGSLVIGALLGVARALTVKIWRVQDGSAMRKGTVVTAALWIVALGAHLGLEAGIDHSTKISGLGASSLLLYLALTLGAQREVIRWRAAQMA
jgi:hypothetical protein